MHAPQQGVGFGLETVHALQKGEVLSLETMHAPQQGVGFGVQIVHITRVSLCISLWEEIRPMEFLFFASNTVAPRYWQGIAYRECGWQVTEYRECS